MRMGACEHRPETRGRTGEALPARPIPYQAMHAPEVPDPGPDVGRVERRRAGFVEIGLGGHEGGNGVGEFCFALTVTEVPSTGR